MKYYLIAGEASGDLHASHLMAALKEEDSQAEFRFFGGDLMAAVGGVMVKHYKELAYMGFIPVLLHLRTIFANMKRCKEDIVAWQPDVLILVDYPGFNLDIAKFVHANTRIPVFYYISPKIWAWKEYRIKNIKRDVDELFSILPFEVEFFEGKHGYPIRYVGNPTVDEVTAFLASSSETFDDFVRANGLPTKPIIALLAGSRKQEIKDNLPDMLRAAASFPDYQLVLAGAPGISPECGWGGREDYLQQDIPFVEAGRGCTGHFGDGNAGNSSVPCAASGVLPYSDRKGYRFPETAYTESEVHFPGQSHSQPGGGERAGCRYHDGRAGTLGAEPHFVR